MLTASVQENVCHGLADGETDVHPHFFLLINNEREGERERERERKREREIYLGMHFHRLRTCSRQTEFPMRCQLHLHPGLLSDLQSFSRELHSSEENNKLERDMVLNLIWYWYLNPPPFKKDSGDILQIIGSHVMCLAKLFGPNTQVFGISCHSVLIRPQRSGQDSSYQNHT